MKKYYVESLDWNVGGQVIWPVLCQNDLGLTGFKQDFERAWTPIEHNSPKECLESARKRVPNSILCLSEDETKILILDDDRACELYRITVE